MEERELVRLSKFLSLVLRHRPQKIGLELDSGGWARVDELITRARDGGIDLDRERLDEVVVRNDKQRFSFSPDGRSIRANQGHSIPVDLGLEPAPPPEYLYHGTVAKFMNSIRSRGLEPRGRQHVHLSKDVGTALKVGQRRGRPVVLQVAAGEMHQAGYRFYRSVNGVWLADHIPPQYLEEIDAVAHV